MKRYIYASKTKEVDIDTSLFKDMPFQCYSGMSSYREFLNHKDLAYKQSAKNRDGKIVMMSPREYYDECAKYGFPEQTSVDTLIRSRRANDANLEKIKRNMQRGVKYHVCMLNYADRSQEGLHRMMAAGDLYGWDTKFPVLVVTPYDQAKEDLHKIMDECYNFNRFTFSNICKLAAANIADSTSAPPDNFTELLRNEVIEEAKVYDDEKEYDIDVEIDTDIIDGYHVVYVYLKRYFDYAPKVLAEPTELWLENLYDMGSSESSDRNPTPTADDDLGDLDISDLFFGE